MWESLEKSTEANPSVFRSLTEALGTGEFVFVTFLGLVTKCIWQKQL